MQPPVVEVKEGDILAGKYRVERVIGSGGMGVVVQATHLKLKDRVALKFLRSPFASDAETLSRFEREAAIAARIKSPHVARVLDVGTLESGSPYTVMEFLEGESLDSILKARGVLDIETAVDWLLQACEALASAHAAGVVHRDIKPSNLFVTRGPDDSPLIKILDFGISKPSWVSEASVLTHSERSMGTPLYMSPEQMRSAKDVDARADIWSLGAVAYEIVTGSLPFMADNLPILCSLVLDASQRAPDPRTLRPDLPEAVSRAIVRCLEKSPEDRFQSVAELAAELAPYAGPSGEVMAARISRILLRSSTSPTGVNTGKVERTGPGAMPSADRMTPATTPSADRVVSSTATAAAREAVTRPDPAPDPSAGEPAGGRFDTATAFGHTQPRIPVNRVAPIVAGVGAIVALGSAVLAGWVFSFRQAEPPLDGGAAAAAAAPSGVPNVAPRPAPSPPAIVESPAVDAPTAAGSASSAPVVTPVQSALAAAPSRSSSSVRATAGASNRAPKASRVENAKSPSTGSGARSEESRAAPGDDVLLLRQ